MFVTQSDTVAIFDLGPRDDERQDSAVLVAGQAVRATRVLVAPDDTPPPSVSSSEMLLYCVAGKVVVELAEITHELAPGSLLFLPPGQEFQLFAREPSVLLSIGSGAEAAAAAAAVTEAVEQPGAIDDPVVEASEESFPASDPPSFNAVSATPANA